MLFNLFNYCRFVSYSEFAFQYIFILRNTESVFVQGRTTVSIMFTQSLCTYPRFLSTSRQESCQSVNKQVTGVTYLKDLLRFFLIN